MSDFIVNLVRRGAGLAPIVRSRPAASLEEVSPAGEGEPQTVVPLSAEPMPVMSAPSRPPSAPASPATEPRPRPIALPIAAAPAAVAQRAAVGTPIAPAPVPAAPRAAVAQPALPERPDLVRATDGPPGRGEIASAREAEAATISMRVVETSPGPRETIVETRRELVPPPVVVVPAELRQPSSDETVTTAIPGAVTATLETPTITPFRIEHVSEIVRAALVRPSRAPESAANDARPAAPDSSGSPPQAPPARPIEVSSRLIPEGGASPRSDDLPAPVPMVARAEPHEDRPDPAPRLATFIATPLKAAPVVARLVELPAAAEIVRRRESVEVAPTQSQSPLPAAQQPPATDRVVEVRIGAVEIHAASPSEPPQQAVPAPARAERPPTGFDEFVRLRTYAPWQW